MQRLYVEDALHPGREVRLNPEQSRYLRSVLRLTAGDRIILFDGAGGEYAAEILTPGKEAAAVLIGEHNPVDREMAANVHIIQAACRSEKIESVLQKGTELGAASFQIVQSRYSDLRLEGEKLAARLARWRRIIIEAAEQSGRTRIPAVSWKGSPADVEAVGLCYLLDPQAGHAWADMRSQIAAGNAVSFAVGPEGGWSGEDIEQLRAKGFRPVRFGPRTLRTETTAPAILAAVQALL